MTKLSDAILTYNEDRYTCSECGHTPLHYISCVDCGKAFCSCHFGDGIDECGYSDPDDYDGRGSYCDEYICYECREKSGGHCARCAKDKKEKKI